MRCRSACTTAASTPRRCSCCWPASTPSAPATRKPWPPSVAGHRGGARLDRRAGRSRRRRLRRISPRQRPGPRQPGLEGLPGRDLPRRRPPGRRPHRAGRSPGLRLCRQDGDRAQRAADGPGRRRAPQLDGRGRAPRRALRSGLLVPRTGHLCAGARRRQAAVPRPHIECRTGPVHRHRAARSRRAWSATGLLEPRFFSGWGIRTVAKGEARYNPMSYHDGSVWPHDNALIALGLARYGLKRSVDAVVQGPVRRRDLHGPAATAGTVLRLPAPAQPWPDALSRRLLAAGLGERHAVLADRGVPGTGIRSATPRDALAQSGAAAVPRRGDAAQSAARRFERRHQGPPPSATTFRSKSCGRAAPSCRFRSFPRAETSPAPGNATRSTATS